MAHPIRWALLGAAAAWAAGPALADTAVGDAGHYLAMRTEVLLNNPAGGAFHLAIHRFPWWIGGGWNRRDIHVRLTGPDGKVAVDRVCDVGPDGCRLDVPAGAKGVYGLDVDPRNGLNYWYVTSSLDQSVAWTGPLEGDALDARWFLCNPFVPRRWWFWVPADATRFTVRAQNCQSRSQREDHGLTILSPRGQRIAVLWGQANPDEQPVQLGQVKRRVQKATVLVEPGTAGRFWAIEVRMGDSHTYSDVNFCLEGVPPYVARSPEEWFDGQTGRPAPVRLYDESQFVQSDRAPDAKNRQWEHWTPCPSLGDPDACEIRCPARLALWNPQGRTLRFVLGTYLPRNMFWRQDEAKPGKWQRLPDERHEQADVTVTGPGGRTVLKDRAAVKHLHEPRDGRYERTLDAGKGVLTVDVTGAEHFWAYTYPATPAVLVGRGVEGGWERFFLDAGTARNWYFLVPRGAKEFSVRAAAAHETDVMHLEVNAPDRTMAEIYDTRGERKVQVPAGLDGKVWHVRLDFGSATRFDAGLVPPRFPSLYVTLDLKGVPGCLAPTWEQWFDPNRPGEPAKRARPSPAAPPNAAGSPKPSGRRSDAGSR